MMTFQEEVINKAIQWIETNITHSLHIDDVAKKTGYSKWHLQRAFKEVTGQSLGSYIRERKLYHASVDLMTTRQSVLDIALNYSFDTQQSFTRSFTRYFNLSPAKWRAANKKS